MTTNALEFVQNATSIQLVVAEINDNNRYKSEDLAAAYAINALTKKELDDFFPSIQKHLEDLVFHQAKFNESEAMRICHKIVDMPSF
jgi:hypothetical protein